MSEASTKNTDIVCCNCNRPQHSAMNMIPIDDNQYLCDKCFAKYEAEMLLDSEDDIDLDASEFLSGICDFSDDNADFDNDLLSNETRIDPLIYLTCRTTGLNEQVRILCEEFDNHLGFVGTPLIPARRHNIFFCGSPHTGKTTLATLLAASARMPIAICDIKDILEAKHNWKAEDIIFDLYYKSNGDLSKAVAGIVLIKNIDILFSANYDSDNTTISAVTQEIEFLIKGAQYQITTKEGVSLSFDTRWLFFIGTGEFPDITRAVLQEDKLCFSQDDLTDKLPVGMAQLFPTAIVFLPLVASDIFDILTKPLVNPIQVYKKFYRQVRDIDLRFSQEFLIDAANSGFESGCGVDGALRYIDKKLKDNPSLSENVPGSYMVTTVGIRPFNPMTDFNDTEVY